MPIKGLTEQRRMPRIGKLHLGIKVKNAKGVEYPKAVDYFVYPAEGSPGSELLDQFKKEYGEKPKELEVIFPLEDEESIASQYYRCYSKSRGLVCRGDGETAMRMIDTTTGDLPNKDSKDTELKEMPCAGRECPDYKKGNCREVMNLQFMLPKISGIGVWQVDSGSINSIRNINSCLEMIKAVYGRVSMIPLLLTIEPIEVTPPGGTKKTVHVLNIRSMDNMIEAAIKARKSPLELIAGPEVVATAEKDIEEMWPPDEEDRKLSLEEAAERKTPKEIAEAAEEKPEAKPEEKTNEPTPQVEEELFPEPEVEPDPAERDKTPVTQEQIADIHKFVGESGMTLADIGKYCNQDKGWRVRDLKDLQKWQYGEICEAFKKGKA